MQHLSSDQVRQTLLSVIDSLLDCPDKFLVNPQSNFTRTKKISFEQTILFPMIAGSDNVADELLDFFGEEGFPFPSAMIQRRNQIKLEAFSALFYRFLQTIKVIRTFFGYQLIATDGSRLNLPYNPSDPDTFIQCIKGRKGINQLHLNTLYDPLNDIFLDVELQTVHQLDEKKAFCSSLDKLALSSSRQKRIFLADRGYASYNVFAHACHNGQLFLIRVPEFFAKGICTRREHWLEDEYVDQEVSVHIGRRRTKENLMLENYHNIPTRGHYDHLEAGSKEVDRLSLRVLKFPIGEGTYEYIVTNLPACSFSLSTVKELYRLRWSHETAYRHLKYAGNMVRLHSRKKEFLLQEIYAKLTAYNFTSAIAAAVGSIEKTTERYTYTVNHTQMQKNCIRFLKGLIKDVDAIIKKFIVPVRPGRKFKRILRRQSADTLNYR